MLTFIFRERLENKRIYKFLVLEELRDIIKNSPYQRVVGYFSVNLENKQYDLPKNVERLISNELLESVAEEQKQKLITDGNYSDKFYYSKEAAKIRREKSKKKAVEKIFEEAKRADKVFFE